MILGVILVARLAGLAFASTDLYVEEAQYWYWSQDLALGYYSKPPILMWLIGLATAVCGDGETCIRLPSPLIATASAYLIFVLARHLYDSRVAFWATIVYATLPAVSAFAMVAMPESILALFWIATLLALSHHLDRLTIASGLGLGLVLGLGVLTDYTMIYLPLCTALFFVATPKARGALRAPGTWLALASAVAVAAPNLLWNAQNEFITFGQTGSLSDWAFRHLNPDATLVFIGLQFILFGPILLYVLLNSVLARRTVTPRADADRFLLFHSVPIFAILLFQVLFFRARAHWSMPAFPAAAIFVTALLLRHGFQRLLIVSIAFHAAILTGLIGLSVFADRLGGVAAVNRLVGWRQFSEELNGAAAVSEIKTIVMRGSGRVSEALYYLRGTDVDILVFNPSGRSQTSNLEKLRDWTYGDPNTILLATERDPTAYGIPLGNADKIGEFPVQSYLSDTGLFSLYRVNPPTEPIPSTQ